MARRKRYVVKRRRKEAWKRRRKGEKNWGTNRRKKRVRAHLFPLLSRHFWNQFRVKQTISRFHAKYYRWTNYVYIILKACHWLLDCTFFVSRSQTCVQEIWLQSRWGSICIKSQKNYVFVLLSLRIKLSNCESPWWTLKWSKSRSLWFPSHL